MNWAWPKSLVGACDNNKIKSTLRLLVPAVEGGRTMIHTAKGQQPCAAYTAEGLPESSNAKIRYLGSRIAVCEIQDPRGH